MHRTNAERPEVAPECAKKDPFVRRIAKMEELSWFNPLLADTKHAIAECPLTFGDMQEAEARMERFAPFFRKAFPKTVPSHGILESSLKELVNLERYCNGKWSGFPSRIMMKCDNDLPVSGSIKARGGIYAVLKHAEETAIDHGMLRFASDYAMLMEPQFRKLFSKYEITVASTGNLGLSVGIVGAKLGFSVTVHMSADAKRWKKDLLREIGCRVIEYQSDYSHAIVCARDRARTDSRTFFVDDENSRDLFLGYSVAALRIRSQFSALGIAVDSAHPLFVYLPCGVGGGPGGIAFGLKQVYGDAVSCFFVEPVHAPAMLLGLVTGLYDKICVQDIGLDGRTAADGLAVGRPSKFVGSLILPFLDGEFTVSDERLLTDLALLYDLEGIRLEPSALAGMAGFGSMVHAEEGARYLRQRGLWNAMPNATHLIWATGGSMLPSAEWETYYRVEKCT